MTTISQQLTELVNQKNALAANLTTKGVEASSSETLNTLVPKVLEIQGGGRELPEYMSAKNFTFDGNACTGYVGDNSFPEIIIPKSYSKIDVFTTGYTFVNISNIRSLNNNSLTSITLCNKNGSNEHTYLDSNQLRHNFDIDFAGQSEVRINSFSYSTNIFTNVAFKTYITSILFAPIVYNNKIYNTIDEFVDEYITLGKKTISPLYGQAIKTTFFDGNDYQVTSIKISYNTVSGFNNYHNRIILLNNITSIDENAFRNCIYLSEISIPSTDVSLTSIGDYAFWGCRYLTCITLPSSLISIGDQAFYNCISLTSITIPKDVTSIGQNAFYECSNMYVMIVLPTTPPTLKSTNAITSVVTKIYIPAGTLSAYQSATNWSNFADLFEELPA